MPGVSQNRQAHPSSSDSQSSRANPPARARRSQRRPIQQLRLETPRDPVRRARFQGPLSTPLGDRNGSVADIHRQLVERLQRPTLCQTRTATATTTAVMPSQSQHPGNGNTGRTPFFPKITVDHSRKPPTGSTSQSGTLGFLVSARQGFSLHPVFQAKSAYPLEFIHVVGHQDAVFGQCMAGDP